MRRRRLKQMPEKPPSGWEILAGCIVIPLVILLFFVGVNVFAIVACKVTEFVLHGFRLDF